jgi:uncharacterized OB-fold protein
VYSWVRVHRPFGGPGGSRDEVPSVFATVDLDEGCRMFGRLEPGDDVAIGTRVRFTFIDHDEWTELRFTPADHTEAPPP